MDIHDAIAWSVAISGVIAAIGVMIVNIIVALKTQHKVDKVRENAERSSSVAVNTARIANEKMRNIESLVNGSAEKLITENQNLRKHIEHLEEMLARGNDPNGL